MVKRVNTIYDDLVTTTLNITRDSHSWISFLKTAAWQYKYRFEDKVMIYHQHPEAKACAPIELWNRMGRWVKKGAKGIALINDAGSRNTLRYVFDVSDTTSRGQGKAAPIWSMQELYEQHVIDVLENKFGYLQNRSDFVSTVMSAVDNVSMDNQDDYFHDLMDCREGSFLEDLDDEYVEVLFGQAIRNSIAYMALIRCGVDADIYYNTEDFAGIVNFGTLDTASRLGAATSDIAELVIREIEQSVKGIEKEERTIIRRLKDEIEKEEGIGEKNELQERRGLSDTGYGVADGGETDREIWNAAQDVPEGKQERDVRESDVIGRTGESFDRDRPDSTGESGADYGATLGEEPGSEQSGRSNGVGETHEQHQAPSGGNGTSGADIQLEWFDRETEDRSLPFFHLSEHINEILRTTPYLKASKQEIEEFFVLHNDSKEQIEYLKSIFNHNITELTIGDDYKVGYKTYQNVLYLWEGTYAEKTSQGYYHWGVIAGHIESMILFKEFNKESFFPSEQQQITLIEQAEQDKRSAFYMPQEAIDHLLQRGGGYENGKCRIYLHFQKNLSVKENIEFLKHAYGTGGRSPAFTGTHIHEWHDSKGITLTEGFEKKTTLSWAKVQKRIGELIAADRYLNRREKKYLPEFEQKEKERLQKQEEAAYAREILNREPVPAEEPEPARDNIQYAFAPGNQVFIGADEYEIFSFENGTVILKDIRYPLLTKEFDRVDFVKLLQENPMNNHLISQGPLDENIETIVLHAGDPDAPEWLEQTGDVQITHAGENIVIESIDPGEKKYVELDIDSPNKAVPGRELSNGEITPVAAKQPKFNFVIKDDNLGHGGAKTKYSYNVAAIRLVKLLEAEGRLATQAEQEILSRYVGWGALPQAFDEKNTQWIKEYAELKDLLSADEYILARKSTLNAFYTSPTVIKSIYIWLKQIGFDTGNILDPGCGIGNFFGLLPESMGGSTLYGIELDSLTGRIAQNLYQNAHIAIQGFEDTELPDSFFDLVIGNVPFGGFGVADKKYDKYKFLIHDYFFAKSLDKVRPGGIIALITSKGTMDKANPAVRKYIAQRAELLGAVRLPNDAFLDNAGTEVTADILFLQKRDRVIDIQPDWVHLSSTDDGIPINQYFADHPDMMLGTMAFDDGMYGNGKDTTLQPIEGAILTEQLEKAVQNIHAQISEYDLEVDSEEKDTSIPADPNVRNFSYCDVDGQIYYRENSRMNPVETSVTGGARIRGMITIRDCVRELIFYQTENYGDEAIKEAQAKLNRLYDDFTAVYGLLNSRANNLAFSDDSSYCLLCSLENLDDDGNLKSKADMFTKRTIRQHTEINRVDTAAEALAVSIAEKACVDIDFMEQLSGLSADQIASDLRGVIFRDLGDAEPGQVPIAFFVLEKCPFVTADEYLSGNVRNKLRLVKDIADKQPELADQLAPNIQALEKAQPKELDASEISVRLGATWVPTDVIRDFLFELLDTPQMYQKNIDVMFSGYSAEWNIKGKSEDRSDNIKARVTYGTSRISAYKIIEDSLNLRDVRIFDTVLEDGKEKRVLNKKETQIAQQKQEAIKDAFQSWVWKDPKRREFLTGIYNERYNSIRPREYDGSHITFAGMNPEKTLDKHQVNGAARVIYGGNTLLAHVVGAGKTYTMTAAAMESKRLGLCNKSLFVVPNHLTEQWGGDFLQLYPSANILVSTKKDFETQNRKKFCARIATGDYDAVIIGHSQFEKIPISAERQKRLIEEQIDEISYGIQDLIESDGERYAIKQMEKTKKNLEIRLKRLNDTKRKDNVVTFEELGVDRLFVDEADNYKNLFLYTKMRNVAGISQTDAQKSSDLFAKCRYMDELTSGRGVIFGTGTPISNSIAEMFTMQRYLQFLLLSRKYLQHFDCWASTFGETVTAIELAPEGTGYRTKTRFARFYNLPELMNMFREVADIQTADMLNLPVPEAHYVNIAVKPSEMQREMVLELADRADQVRNRLVEPYEDNMLKITNDGRKLALDQRLMNPLLPDYEGSKVNECIRNVFRIWEETAPQKLTQIIFCDLSTPKKRRIEMKIVDGVATMMEGQFYSVYDDVREKLITLGIPAEEIAFIHEANTDLQKKELFAKVRSGKVRVFMGSTFRMGAGTNVQDLLYAIHDLDCPWRPRDLEQRAGRIVRRGNKNKEVYIYRYVTEQTFDSYLYQILENKQKFISQVMTSKSTLRSAEDIDDTALSYAEVKALATGNPLIKEKMSLDIDVTKLKTLKANHLRQYYELEDRVLKYFPQDIRRTESRIQGLKRDLTSYKEQAKSIVSDGKEGSKFAGMTINGITLIEKASAGTAILEACKGVKSSDPRELGNYMGFKLLLSFDTWNHKYEIHLQGVLTYKVELGSDAMGNVSRINHTLESIPERLKAATEQLDTLNHQMETAKEQLDVPFEKEEELQTKSARLAELNAMLNMDKSESAVIIDDEKLEVSEMDDPNVDEGDKKEKSDIELAYDAIFETGNVGRQITEIIER